MVTFNKIFGIGLSHTATKSLNQGLETLGIPSIHWPIDFTTYRELSSGNYQLSILKKYRAITDITVVPFYKQLDKAHPGSKFILTLRDKQSWLRSMARVNVLWKRYAHKPLPHKYVMRVVDDWPAYGIKALKSAAAHTFRSPVIEFYRVTTYGALCFQGMDALSDFYDSYHQSVRDYFKDRPEDLLEMYICDGEGWGKLCSFLQAPRPEQEFPKIFDRKRFMNIEVSE